MEEKRVYIELPAFTGRNVPISELAKARCSIHSYRITNGYLKIWICIEKRKFFRI